MGGSKSLISGRGPIQMLDEYFLLLKIILDSSATGEGVAVRNVSELQIRVGAGPLSIKYCIVKSERG